MTYNIKSRFFEIERKQHQKKFLLIIALTTASVALLVVAYVAANWFSVILLPFAAAITVSCVISTFDLIGRGFFRGDNVFAVAGVVGVIFIQAMCIIASMAGFMISAISMLFLHGVAR